MDEVGTPHPSLLPLPPLSPRMVTPPPRPLSTFWSGGGKEEEVTKAGQRERERARAREREKARERTRRVDFELQQKDSEIARTRESSLDRFGLLAHFLFMYAWVDCTLQ